MRKKEHKEKKSMNAEYAYCAVDSTKCEGLCRDKNIEHGTVYCSEVIGEEQALNKKERIRRQRQ